MSPSQRARKGSNRPDSGSVAGLFLPGTFAATLVALAFFPPIRRDPNLFSTFLGAAFVLLVWNVALYVLARGARRDLQIEVVVRRQHWVQACAQLAIFVWWGWHVRSIIVFAPLILAQLLFAYGVDGLLAWSRRDRYSFGFGPIPIIFSINLFLWFKPEWFHWQFVMIVMGYLAKELIRWNRDGRSAHIFNPSSFPLAVGSLALILTGKTDITLGAEIAQTQAIPPYMYLVIFLASVPGQMLFGVARMTMSAVVTMFVIAYGYFAVTGTYLSYDAFISVPVFLGMHLLFTDPSTAPRTETGQAAFGVLYAVGTTVMLFALTAVGAPGFYDKLLPVPLMNLAVRAIDGSARTGWLSRLDLARVGQALTPRMRHLAYTSVWAVIFAALSGFQGVGDDHPGQYLPFWQGACAEGSERACDYAIFMTANYCSKGSGWACNEWGGHLLGLGATRNSSEAFRRACDLGFPEGCSNAARTGTNAVARAGPRDSDLPVVLRGSKGPVTEQDPVALRAFGCEQGWTVLCAPSPGGSPP